MLDRGQRREQHGKSAKGKARPRRHSEGQSRKAAAARRSRRRRAPATACRRCPSSASWSTASTGSSASRRSSSRCATSAPPTACPPTRSSTIDPRPVPRLPGHAAGRPAAPAGAVRDRRRGPQGRRRRQRRHPGVHRAAAGPRRAGPAVPAGQGGDARRCWRTTCPKSRYRKPGERVVQGQRMMQAASDIFLGWTEGRRGRPVLLLAAAARHEGLRAWSRR